MSTIFLHVVKPDMLPVDSVYVNTTDIAQYENNSIDNIIVQDLFDYLLDTEITDLLQVIHSKLSPNGKLHIQATDLKQLSIAIAFNDIDAKLAQKILYPYKKSISLLSDITQILNNNGFTIEVSYYTNLFEYYLVCIKNV